MKSKVILCGVKECRKPMLRKNADRISIFHGRICRECALNLPLIETVAEGLARIIKKEAKV